ncbi:MAG: ferric reductase-like transmembrane domain-containing protein [Alicyclobacillaceae bacterium]|nr:ferric reductase-like transmembrane domain-containing protein [Alicyclobacillaceae bacterium]
MPSNRKPHEAGRREIPSVLVLAAPTIWSLFFGAWLVMIRPGAAGEIDWLIVRASGITAFALLTAVVALGAIMAHPKNKEQWRATSKLMPWHRALGTVALGFLLTHLTLLLLDDRSGFGLKELLIPFAGDYRPFAVAMGIGSFYLMIIILVTAHFPRLLPYPSWLTVHRIAAASWIAAWFHGVLAGTDTPGLRGFYEICGIAMSALLLSRYWRAARPSPASKERRLTP